MGISRVHSVSIKQGLMQGKYFLFRYFILLVGQIFYISAVSELLFITHFYFIFCSLNEGLSAQRD